MIDDLTRERVAPKSRYVIITGELHHCVSYPTRPS